MTRPALPVTDRKIQWPTRPNAAPLWGLHDTPAESRVIPCPGRARPLELVADPFSS